MVSNNTKHPQIKAVSTANAHLGLLALLLFVPLVLVITTFNGLNHMPREVLIFSIPLGLIILVGTSLSFRGYMQARKLDRFGEITEGTIVDAWINRDADGDKTYHVAYQFGSDIQVDQEIRQWDFQKLFVGSKVTVRYLPDDPSCSRMEIKNWR